MDILKGRSDSIQRSLSAGRQAVQENTGTVWFL